MSLQRGVLRRRGVLRGEPPQEIIADIQCFASPEVGSELQDGRAVLKIKSVQPVCESSMVDGDYDFIPVTAGLFPAETILHLRKSDGSWDWRDK
jgi:hypothetical protein